MENTNPPRKKSRVLFIIIGIVAVAAFFGIRSLLHNLKYETTDNAQIESRSVPVISRVAGYIDSLGVDDYGQVSADKTIIKIDDAEYALAAAQAKADWMNARADEVNAQASYQNALANKKLASANADVQLTRLNKAKADLTRDEALLKEGAITTKQLEDSRSNYDASNKQYTANRDQINLASTQVAIAEAQIQKVKALIETRKAAYDQAQLKLSYCRIVAPISGRIGKRTIEKGQFVQAGAPLFSIVNSESFWIVANFKETQLEKMREGQEVNVKIDGYPDADLKGKVSAFSQATGSKFALLPADNSTGNFVKVTQRVPVKIEIVNPAEYKNILRAGLSVEVEVNVQ
ncbi:MAG TPA: HlyD family secretion protein [Cyclobacteriaceae bacterium]|nr:HlyD family secretion protein [Cyclobacteriaceae bacterium]HMV08683.1 HlyD family secretion protein [Cyclobacteriaceae bacterium]HMV91561.1 HlyD family secretion protein [Cyclobacteriaceae bacterium]HMX00108.1 HlyD family secretion protein [Cyclobacteriaceae bacterium]HMX49030.1 HlyD family secretion protein [Cyclobacteriaceae bacterium]